MPLNVRAILLVVFATVPLSASADIVMFAFDRGDGGTRLEITGTSTAVAAIAADTLWGTFTTGFDISTVGFPTTAVFGGTVVNTTQALTFNAVSTDQLFEDDGTGGDDDHLIATDGITAAIGDTLVFNLFYEWTPAVLPIGAGAILGTYDLTGLEEYAQVDGTVILQVVPEPGSLGLLLLGCAGFGLGRRRRTAVSSSS